MDTVVLPFVFIVVALLVAASCSPGYAQQQVATRFQYAAKTLCTLGGDTGFGDAFAPGRYRTVINIHNPADRKIESRASSHSPSSRERPRVHSASLRTSH
jgi:DNA-binding transcriptional regulator of glucitol operon